MAFEALNQLDGKGMLRLMASRHSVRQYTDQVIGGDVREALKTAVSECNQEGDMHMQLFFDEPSCFDAMIAHYGRFTGVRNYLAVVGPKTADLEEKAGYYGEKIVMLAQALGLNSCWVGLNHGRSQATIGRDEKQIIVIALGYGENQGVPHRTKSAADLCSVTAGSVPAWFKDGMKGAMLAPTAINQQKFLIRYDGDHLTAAKNGRGFFTKTDLGIVKCDFELASGHKFDTL